MITKTSWYRPHNAVGFFPPTPDANLLKRIQAIVTRNVSKLGLSVKCIETGGVNLRSMLVKLDLTGCLMPHCILCQSGQKGGSHTRSGSVYSGKCKLCEKENRVAQYFGETGSGGYCRMEKHKQQIKSQNLSNGFAKHLEVHHKDQVKNENVFDMKIEKNFMRVIGLLLTSVMYC